jgi:hypothetical protein
MHRTPRRCFGFILSIVGAASVIRSVGPLRPLRTAAHVIKENMNKKIVAREWLIFAVSCVAFFPLVFILRFFAIDILPLMFVGMLLTNLLVLAVRFTVWAVRQLKS